MGKQFKEISESHIEFVVKQKIFFVGTATTEGRVNISPKGMDSLRIIEPNRVIWLNATGSGNETSAHIQSNPRITLMFTSFEGKPLTLRFYGVARVIHRNDPEWENLYSLLPSNSGARQIFDCDIDLVQTSCGMSIPYFEYGGEREALNDWARKRGPEGLKEYWLEKNQQSIDGKATHIKVRNT